MKDAHEIQNFADFQLIPSLELLRKNMRYMTRVMWGIMALPLLGSLYLLCKGEVGKSIICFLVYFVPIWIIYLMGRRRMSTTEGLMRYEGSFWVSGAEFIAAYRNKEIRVSLEDISSVDPKARYRPFYFGFYIVLRMRSDSLLRQILPKKKFFRLYPHSYGPHALETFLARLVLAVQSEKE